MPWKGRQCRGDGERNCEIKPFLNGFKAAVCLPKTEKVANLWRRISGPGTHELELTSKKHRSGVCKRGATGVELASLWGRNESLLPMSERVSLPPPGNPVLTLADRAEMEEVTRRFERSWLNEKTPVIDETLLPPGAARIPTALEICAIDVDFRRRRNLPVRNEYYLQVLAGLSASDAFLQGLEAIVKRHPDRLSPDMLGRIGKRLRESGVASEDSTIQRSSQRETLGAPTMAGGDRTLPHDSALGSSASFQFFHSMLTSGVAAAQATEESERGGGMEGSAETPQLPASLAHYRLVKFVARGATGEVWCGRDDREQSVVAIKITPHSAFPSIHSSDDLRRRCREACQDHPNLVPILHNVSDANNDYQVMPLLKGETLEIRLTRMRGLPPLEVARIGRELAAALQRLHGAGLVHHDIKPANIWLDAITHRARLIDFGLAMESDRDDSAGLLRGTPAYHAPEVVDGDAYLAQSDLYSLGVVLYECATGQRHNRGATITSAQEFILHGKAPPICQVNPEFPADLARIIERLLARKLGTRTKTAQELDQQLIAWFEAELLPERERAVTSVPPIVTNKRLLASLLWLGAIGVIFMGVLAYFSLL